MENFRIDDIARRLAEAVPGVLGNLRHDLELNFRQVLQGAFGKLELTTREEFQVQVRVLERALRQVESLEARVAALEAQPPS